MIPWHYGLKSQEASISQTSYVEKEMGYSRQEFFNQFTLFSKRHSDSFITQFDSKVGYPDVDNTITIQACHSSSLISITLSEMSVRSIGSLKIPRLLVKFSFSQYTEAQQKDFLKQFDLSFQRGGG